MATYCIRKHRSKVQIDLISLWFNTIQNILISLRLRTQIPQLVYRDSAWSSSPFPGRVCTVSSHSVNQALWPPFTPCLICALFLPWLGPSYREHVEFPTHPHSSKAPMSFSPGKPGGIFPNHLGPRLDLLTTLSFPPSHHSSVWALIYLAFWFPD